jgi:hypothetical protein
MPSWSAPHGRFNGFSLGAASLSRESKSACGSVVFETCSGFSSPIEGRRGILTCGHVAEAYGKLPEIGLIRFLAHAWRLPKKALP